ncbi:MAG: hypothetical protein R3C10_25570 [Pirellulales bacterium]
MSESKAILIVSLGRSAADASPSSFPSALRPVVSIAAPADAAIFRNDEREMGSKKMPGMDVALLGEFS